MNELVNSTAVFCTAQVVATVERAELQRCALCGTLLVTESWQHLLSGHQHAILGFRPDELKVTLRFQLSLAVTPLVLARRRL